MAAINSFFTKIFKFHSKKKYKILKNTKLKNVMQSIKELILIDNFLDVVVSLWPIWPWLWLGCTFLERWLIDLQMAMGVAPSPSSITTHHPKVLPDWLLPQ